MATRRGGERGGEQPLDIADVVSRSGVPTSTLHVWERKGLIRSIGRNGLRRQYHPTVLRTIAIVVLCQRSGFTLAEIAGLLAPGAFDDGKQPLADKLGDLQRLRADIDTAIDGLQHALDCPSPSPLNCPGFLRHLDGVLPAERGERARFGT